MKRNILIATVVICVICCGVYAAEKEIEEDEWEQVVVDTQKWLHEQGYREIQETLDEIRKSLDLFEEKEPEKRNHGALNLVNQYRQWVGTLDNYRNILQKEGGSIAALNLAKVEEMQKRMDGLYNQGPWQQGAKIMQAVLGTPRFIDPEGYLQSVSAVMWYLYERAVLKGQTFSEGTFVLEDPQQRIQNFFLQRDVFGPTVRPPYQRISSHYPEIKVQYGIDVMHGSTQFGLPNDKAHILLGHAPKGNKKHLFVKLEEHGIGDFWDTLGHSVNYVKSLGRRMLVAGANDQKDYRKERVPDDILKAWTKLVHLIDPLPDPEGWVAWGASFVQSHEKVQKAKKGGIGTMLDMYLELAKGITMQDASPEVKQADLEFRRSLKGFDNSTIRKGREVILLSADLLP